MTATMEYHRNTARDHVGHFATEAVGISPELRELLHGNGKPKPRRAARHFHADERVSWGVLLKRQGTVIGHYDRFVVVVEDGGEDAGEMRYLPNWEVSCA